MGPPVDPIQPDDALPDAVEVVVIGGGIIGTSTALALARRGVSVALCEKGHVAGEQSSRNWGWVRKGRRDPREIPLIVESLRLWGQMNETVGAETGFRASGVVWGCESDADVVRYDALGEAWWDPKGAMAPLHRLNPTRIRYIRDLAMRHFAVGPEVPLPLSGLSIVDIGSGGGLLSEPLARLGGRVTGIDPAPNNVAVAARHAAEGGVTVDYRATTAETLAEAGELFDVVLALEVVEHVPDPDAFVATACALVRPGGLFVLSTLNRTAKSFALAIVGAEYLLRWLPRGTHDWRQFRTPDEIAAPVRVAGLKVLERTGMVFDPLRGRWGLSRDTDVNYLLAAKRPA